MLVVNEHMRRFERSELGGDIGNVLLKQPDVLPSLVAPFLCPRCGLFGSVFADFDMPTVTGLGFLEAFDFGGGRRGSLG